MKPLEHRIKLAQQDWALGKQAEDNNDLPLAYQHYTTAHDRIMDCARLHQEAHNHLRRVNAKIGNYGEYLTDWALHILSPLGVFELVAYLSGTGALKDRLCQRYR